jgi:hypothetical protein
MAADEAAKILNIEVGAGKDVVEKVSTCSCRDKPVNSEFL